MSTVFESPSFMAWLGISVDLCGNSKGVHSIQLPFLFQLFLCVKMISSRSPIDQVVLLPWMMSDNRRLRGCESYFFSHIIIFWNLMKANRNIQYFARVLCIRFQIRIASSWRTTRYKRWTLTGRFRSRSLILRFFYGLGEAVDVTSTSFRFIHGSSHLLVKWTVTYFESWSH